MNQVPNTETKMYKANGAIAKGDVVGLLVSTGQTGYTVDQTNGSTIAPVGVAAETAVDGAWFQVVVGGYCNYVTNNGTDIVAGDYLVAGAGVAVPTTTAEIALTTCSPHLFGQALEAETGTTLTTAIIYKKY
jgi:hypothetical protein